MMRAHIPLVELRQYTLHRGRRDELIDLFDRQFVDSQEACGMTVIGQFRDPDRPDHFVWLRGFDDMAARLSAMNAFYPGPVWRAHRDAANATMIDSDDVLLLRPFGADDGLSLGDRAPPGAEGGGEGVVVVGVHRLTGPDDAAVARFAADRRALAEAVLAVDTTLITDPSPNDFPGLPVREDEWVLVWLSRQPDAAQAEAAVARARADARLTSLFASSLQLMRLVPTARSRLRGA